MVLAGRTWVHVFVFIQNLFWNLCSLELKCWTSCPQVVMKIYLAHPCVKLLGKRNMPLQMRFYTHMCAQRSHVMCPWRSVKRTQPWWSDGSNSFLWPPVSFFQFLLQPFDTGSSLMPTDILIDSIQSSILEVMDTNEPILFHKVR